jgi:hypothetical protein
LNRLVAVGREVLTGLLLFAAVAVVGLALLALLFGLGIAAGMDILFYRGVVLSAVAALATALLFARFVSPREAVAAAVLAFGLDIAFVVVLPVTIDRSISVFILATMEATPERVFTTADVEHAFTVVYVGDMRQIERRMHEQELSGNVGRSDGGYVLTPQGRAFVAFGRRVADLFGADRRLIDAKPPAR